jgi:hypothetical protein
MKIDLKLRTSPVFEPLLAPARYKGAWGGRGSAFSYNAGTPLPCSRFPATELEGCRTWLRQVSQVGRGGASAGGSTAQAVQGPELPR